MGFNGDMYIWKDRRRFLGMPLSFTRYAMSEDRLFLSVGFFSIRDDEILLYRIRDITLTRTLWQRIFGVGSITLITSDKSTPNLVLKNVKHAYETKELLHENVEEAKIRRRMRFSEMLTDIDNDDETDNDFDDEND